jgi:hypothetical protein
VSIKQLNPVAAIKNAPVPKDVGEVRSFLAMTNYVGRFIPNYSTITEPLRRLTKQDTTANPTGLASTIKTVSLFGSKYAITRSVVSSLFNFSNDLCCSVDQCHLVSCLVNLRNGSVIVE